jgi:hypothetical protein
VTPEPLQAFVERAAAAPLWLVGAAQRFVVALGALGTTVETRVSSTVTDPWTGQRSQR